MLDVENNGAGERRTTHDAIAPRRPSRTARSDTLLAPVVRDGHRLAPRDGVVFAAAAVGMDAAEAHLVRRGRLGLPLGAGAWVSGPVTGLQWGR